MSDNTTAPSTMPTTDPTTGLEVPRTLTHDTYKGHKLSVKPGEVETVSLYLNKTLVDDLSEMSTKIDEAKTRVENKANENPNVPVPGSFSTAYENASKAISTALEDVQDAVTKLRNIADAICQYGDGGWATPYSVLKHLNDFIYSDKNGSGGDPSGGGSGGDEGGSADDLLNNEILEPSNPETTIPVGGPGGNIDGGNLNTLDEEIVLSEIAGPNNVGNGKGNGIVVPSIGEVKDDNLEDNSLENVSDIGGSTLSGFSSFIVPGTNKSEIRGTKSASVLGTLGLTAAAAVALGVKISHDKIEDDEENADDIDDSDVDSSVLYSNNSEMLKMKKKIFGIGDDK